MRSLDEEGVSRRIKCSGVDVVSKAHAAVGDWGEGVVLPNKEPPSQQDIATSRKVLARLATTTQPQQIPKTENLLDSRGYQPFHELGPPPARHKRLLKPSSKALLLPWSLPRLFC